MKRDGKMKYVKRRKLADFSKDREEMDYWSSRTIEERLEAVEILRARWQKFNESKRGNGDFKGLRRVLRVTQLS
ncbi:MAG: hypothetical protein M1470_13435 [Bacteroidetes bacterium]|nr:hypothetical protein [Bacteroidota bacterium]MCL5738429.1 hypothetical protein [Bacteroidota bacterium]